MARAVRPKLGASRSWTFRQWIGKKGTSISITRLLLIAITATAVVSINLSMISHFRPVGHPLDGMVPVVMSKVILIVKPGMEIMEAAHIWGTIVHRRVAPVCPIIVHEM